MIAQTPFSSVILTAHGPVFRCDQRVHMPEHSPFVIVKPARVGVCSSDLKEVRGVRLYRHDFGHEIVGTLWETNLCDTLQPGDRVVYDPHVHLQRNSGFSELVVAISSPELLNNAFLKVSEDVDVDKLVFLEPLACIAHAYRRLEAVVPSIRERRGRLGIIGAGNAGTLAAYYGRHLGFAVTLINRSSERLKFLQNAGLLPGLEMALCHELDGDSFDVVFLTTSFLSADVVQLGLNSVANNGTVVLYGGTTPGTNCNGADLDCLRRSERHALIQWREKPVTLIGTHGAVRTDFVVAYEAMRAKPRQFPLEQLITRRVRLPQLPELLISMSRAVDHCTGKAVVTFSLS